jgi:hypothetical protein
MITLDLLQEKNWKNFFEQTNIKKSAWNNNNYLGPIFQWLRLSQYDFAHFQNSPIFTLENINGIHIFLISIALSHGQGDKRMNPKKLYVLRLFSIIYRIIFGKLLLVISCLLDNLPIGHQVLSLSLIFDWISFDSSKNNLML